MEKRTYHIYGIKWDATRSERKDLPKTMDITVTEDDVDDINDIEEVEDYLSDTITEETGFCHKGFEYEETTLTIPNN